MGAKTANTPSTQIIRHEPIYGLDLVRFFSAFFVMCYHLSFVAFANPDSYIHQSINQKAALPSWWMFSFWGWLGVQVFFVISGLVIAGSAERSASLTHFITNRLLRLIPALFITMTICAFLAIFYFGEEVSAVTILYLKSIMLEPFGPWLSAVVWTLPMEVVFYALVGVFIAFKRVQYIEYLAYVIGGICALNWLILIPQDLIDLPYRIRQLLLIQHGCYFAIGLILYSAYQHSFSLLRVMFLGLMTITSFLQIKSLVTFESIKYQLTDHVSQSTHLLVFVIWLVLLLFIVLAVFYRRTIAMACKQSGIVAPLRIMGLATYPLYLLHVHVGGMVLSMMLNAGGNPIFAILSGVFISIGVSVLITIWFEPFIKAGLRKLLMRSHN